MILKHFFLFKKERVALDSAAAWRDLRNDPNESAFFIPETKEQYETLCLQNVHRDFVAFISDFAEKKQCTHIFSVGSGVGVLEYWLKKNTLPVYAQQKAFYGQFSTFFYNKYPNC